MMEGNDDVEYQMAVTDGNALFEKLSQMTKEERSRMFFDCWYNFFDVSEAFNCLLEWDDETCEYVEKLGGFEDKPECEKLLTEDEMKTVVREAIESAWDSNDHWDRPDFIQREMQGGICNILKKKAEAKQGNKQRKEE